MSVATCVQLTEEQQKFLASLEEEFKDRYTEKDEEFSAVLNEQLPLPPLVENWREFRQHDDRQGGERNYRDRDRGRRRDRYDYESNRYSRSSMRNSFHNTYRLY